MGRGGEAEQVQVCASDVGQTGVGQVIPELDAIRQPRAANRHRHGSLQRKQLLLHHTFRQSTAEADVARDSIFPQ